MASVRGRHDALAVRAEAARVHLVNRLCPENNGFTGTAILVQGPDANRLIVGAGHHVSAGSIEDAVATGGSGCHSAVMTPENEGLAGAIRVPDPRRLIPGRGDNAAPVGAERRGIDSVLVTLENY